MFNILPFLLSFLFLASCTHDTLKKSTEEKTELNTINELYKNTPLEIKVYFDKNVESLGTSEYVIRQSQTSDPLIFSIDSYLNGVSKQESNLGFKTNNLGIESFNIKVKNRTALINFSSSDLDIKGPEQILNFTYNIMLTAEQFDHIDDVTICINNTYNYQMALLANEDPVPCPFSF